MAQPVVWRVGRIRQGRLPRSAPPSWAAFSFQNRQWLRLPNQDLPSSSGLRWADDAVLLHPLDYRCKSRRFIDQRRMRYAAGSDVDDWRYIWSISGSSMLTIRIRLRRRQSRQKDWERCDEPQIVQSPELQGKSLGAYGLQQRNVLPS